MDHRLLEIIACPVCNGKLWYNQEKQELICKLDNLAFPLRDGIPVLLMRVNHECCGHYSRALRVHASAR